MPKKIDKNKIINNSKKKKSFLIKSNINGENAHSSQKKSSRPIANSRSKNANAPTNIDKAPTLKDLLDSLELNS